MFLAECYLSLDGMGYFSVVGPQGFKNGKNKVVCFCAIASFGKYKAAQYDCMFGIRKKNKNEESASFKHSCVCVCVCVNL